MAGNRGGYRRPTNPAPASGPGRLSRRTDGGPGQKLMNSAAGGAYGDGTALLSQERGAAMSQADVQPSASVPTGPQAGGAPAPPAGAFGAGTTRPGEPVTSGTDIGAGPGAAALGLGGNGVRPDGYLTSMLQQMSASDMTGTLADLYVIARQRGV